MPAAKVAEAMRKYGIDPAKPAPWTVVALESDTMSTIEVKVPDIGDFKDVPVIEIFVKPGDAVKAEDSLVTLESDKATMDVPSPAAGIVQGIEGQAGRQGRAKARRSCRSNGRRGARRQPPAPQRRAPPPRTPPAPAAAPLRRDTVRLRAARRAPAPAPRAAAAAQPVDGATFKAAHASPSVRKFARELGVDLARVTGAGPKGRILQEDVQKFVKQALSGGAGRGCGGGVSGGGALNLLPWPTVDFAKFGPVEAAAAVADQEDLRREPRAQLGDDPARHAVRRGGHHRPRGLPRHAQQGEREGRHQGDDARVPDQGERGRAAGSFRMSTPRSTATI